MNTDQIYCYLKQRQESFSYYFGDCLVYCCYFVRKQFIISYREGYNHSHYGAYLGLSHLNYSLRVLQSQEDFQQFSCRVFDNALNLFLGMLELKYFFSCSKFLVLQKCTHEQPLESVINLRYQQPSLFDLEPYHLLRKESQ